MRKLSLVLVCLLIAISARAQTPVALAPVAKQQFLDSTGVPLSGGCIFTYLAGTNTPATTYADSSGLVANPNPIILDAAGMASIYLSNQSYKFTAWSQGGVNCATGSQLWSQDNVSAYQAANQLSNIFLAGVTSDPAGTAGELGYRSDLGRVRFFNVQWDSIPGLSTVDTFTNKTFNITQNTFLNSTNTAGHYMRNNGTQYVDSAIQLADIPPINLAAGNVNGGVTGVLPPANEGSGTPSSSNFLRGDGTWATVINPIPIVQVDMTGKSSAISGSAILTPTANGFYRATAYAVVTQAASTSSTLGPIFINYTDGDSGQPETATLDFGNNGNAIGTVANSAGANNSTPWGFYAKAGSVISFSVTYISSGSTQMQYAVHIRVEGPF